MATAVRGEKIRIEKFEAPPFDNNSYLTVCQSGGDNIPVNAPREK